MGPDGRKNGSLFVPRMDSLVVYTRRHLPFTNGDSRGLGVGFIFSSCCTTASTASLSSSVAARPRLSGSIRSSNCVAYKAVSNEDHDPLIRACTSVGCQVCCSC
eukprot:GHUV01034708.1.p2 GENE.GHUV01034708.1~~GHUV01034708.1.p2  ORF type:complete len:104 (+),score=7.84 GHUV01034708.1:775-1086(+)